MSDLTKKTYGPNAGIARTVYRRNDDLDAEANDPYAMGYDAGENMENPPACPFKNDGMAAKLWRKGFSARVDLYIADRKRWGGINAKIS